MLLFDVLSETSWPLFSNLWGLTYPAISLRTQCSSDSRCTHQIVSLFLHLLEDFCISLHSLYTIRTYFLKRHCMLSLWSDEVNHFSHLIWTHSSHIIFIMQRCCLLCLRLWRIEVRFLHELRFNKGRSSPFRRSENFTIKRSCYFSEWPSHCLFQHNLIVVFNSSLSTRWALISHIKLIFSLIAQH